MRIAGSEIAVDSRMSRKRFQSVEKGDDRLVKSALKELRLADTHQMRAISFAGAWAKCGLEVLDCDIEIPCPQPEPAAHAPTASKTRVEYERSVGQRNCRIDV